MGWGVVERTEGLETGDIFAAKASLPFKFRYTTNYKKISLQICRRNRLSYIERYNSLIRQSLQIINSVLLRLLFCINKFVFRLKIQTTLHRCSDGGFQVFREMHLKENNVLMYFLIKIGSES